MKNTGMTFVSAELLRTARRLISTDESFDRGYDTGVGLARQLEWCSLDVLLAARTIAEGTIYHYLKTAFDRKLEASGWKGTGQVPADLFCKDAGEIVRLSRAVQRRVSKIEGNAFLGCLAGVLEEANEHNLASLVYQEAEKNEKTASDRMSMEFDTEDAKKKYEQEHDVRPGTKLTVNKSESDKSTSPAVSTSPASPKKHDFSDETFYKERPKLKSAIEKAKAIVSEIEGIQAKDKTKGEEFEAKKLETQAEARMARGQKDYKDSTPEEKAMSDDIWKKSGLKEMDEERAKLRSEAFEKQKGIREEMEKSEFPEVAKLFDPRYKDLDDVKKVLVDLHVRVHGEKFREMTKDVIYAKPEDVQAGDTLLKRGALYHVDRKTPSGQMMMTHIHTGEKLRETPKSFNGYQKLNSEQTEYAMALWDEVKKGQSGMTKESRIAAKIVRSMTISADIRNLSKIEIDQISREWKSRAGKYRAGKFRSGQAVKWDGELWYVYDFQAHADVPEKFLLTLVSANLRHMADNVSVSEVEA